MVKETRIVVTPGDVLCVRITCPRCRNAVVLRLDNEERAIPDRCPVCNDLWTVGDADRSPVAARVIQDLLASLRRLAADNADYVELEFKDTEQR